MQQLQAQPSTLREHYVRDGFCLTGPIIAHDMIEQTLPHMEAVFAKVYETGIEPEQRWWNPGDDPCAIRRVGNPQWCDATILDFVTQPAIGRLVADLTGARDIRIWGVQMIDKPPATADAGKSVIGWHQDDQYWSMYGKGEIVTVWIAMNDVTIDSGPVRFVRGSQRWGARPGGDFYNGDLETLRKAMLADSAQRWEECPAVLPRGAVSVHDRLTIHGSGPNISPTHRMCFSVHYFTERMTLLEPVPPKMSRMYDLTWHARVRLE
jgi:ectoine hydroxylase-related dioxygenase (phytanoyl-CoA dioxygenase family)